MERGEREGEGNKGDGKREQVKMEREEKQCKGNKGEKQNN